MLSLVTANTCRIDMGWLTAPNYSSRDKGERKGYTYCLFSPELLIPSQSFCLPPYYVADASCQDHGGVDEVIYRPG